MADSRHSIAVIEKSLQYAESRNWTVVESHRGNCWGVIRCPRASDECQKAIWAKPSDLFKHAQEIRTFVNQCHH